MRSRAASMSRKVTTNSALDCCLGCCQSRNRNPERATAYIVQAESVTEFDTRRLAAVFATNSKLYVGPGFASQIAGDLHQASDAFLIDRCERIRIDDVEFGISREETAGVIPAHSESCLGKIVGAETEELGIAGDLVGHERRARDFDHRSDEITEFGLSFLRHFGRDAADDIDLKLYPARKSHQRNHDFGADLNSVCLHFRGRFKDCARLHFGNFGINDAETTTAMAKHGIKFMQLVHAPGDFFGGHAEPIRQFALLRVIGRKKFVQRRIEKPDRGGETLLWGEKGDRETGSWRANLLVR